MEAIAEPTEAPIDYTELVKHSGKPKYFDVNLYLKCINYMKWHDIHFSNEMLDRIPAYYRDFPIDDKETRYAEGKLLLEDFITSIVGMVNADEYAFAWQRMIPKSLEIWPLNEGLLKLKRWMAQKLISDRDYADGEVEVGAELITKEFWEHDSNYRFHTVDQIVAMYNAQGKTPWIVDYGPANYTILQGLRMNNRSFAYKGIMFKPLKEYPPEWQERQKFNQPFIYVAEEIIEHLWDMDSIYRYSVQEGFEPDWVVLSTPRHTFNGGVDHRRSLYMGHIRTFTAKDLANFGLSHWPLYTAQMIDGPQLVLILQKEGYLAHSSNR